MKKKMLEIKTSKEIKTKKTTVTEMNQVFDGVIGTLDWLICS